MDGEALEGLLYHLEEGITFAQPGQGRAGALANDSSGILETSLDRVSGRKRAGMAGDRTTYGVADLSADDSLVGVTDGNQALEVNFDTLSGWAQDFQILLSL